MKLFYAVPPFQDDKQYLMIIIFTGPKNRMVFVPYEKHNKLKLLGFLLCRLVVCQSDSTPPLIIGPESDHWHCLSVTHSLTHTRF